ncbi:MAG: inositol-phosphate phosphatase [Granulosicoccus sp.]|nr:inositol-phosphate phosphatase [Granulosicoccus sp.]
MELDMAAALLAAEEAALAAQQVIDEYVSRGDWKVTLKSDNSPVTEVDLAAEQAIKSVLVRALPQAAFFGEETGAADAAIADAEGARLRWLVDPIDGTKSFIRGMRYYSTQIALEVDQQIRLGVSNAPAYGERVTAVLGQGTRLDGRRIHCSEITSIDDAFFSAGNLTTLARDASRWSRYGTLVSRARRVRGYGDFCHYHQLCSGQADLVLESDVNILDIAALSLAVAEAGGIMTDMTGQPVTEATTSVLAACTVALHDEALSLLHGPRS